MEAIMDVLPPSCVPYTVLLFNGIVFHMIRRVTFRFCPLGLKLLIGEIIATLELCTACAELGVVYEIHGYLGLGIALLMLCFWWGTVWDDAEACPCGPFEECLFGSGLSRRITKQLIGQAVGGALTTFWIHYIWSFHMTPEHESLHTAAECQAGLQVHMVYGAIIEGLITLISRVTTLESVYWAPLGALSANSIITTLLVLAATSTTGGFFNPVLATALTLGCEGNTVVEHLVVYWVGALIGGFIGRYIFFLLHVNDKVKDL